MRAFEWAIEDIIAAYPLLGLDQCAAMAVALMKAAESPCKFLVQTDGFDLVDLPGEDRFLLNVSWNGETQVRAERVERTKQRSAIVEGGAVGLAALLFSHLVRDSEWDLTIRGDGPDYWLPQLHQALEISDTEHVSEVNRRAREKRRQLLGNWRGWNDYVVICCFADGHRLIQWNR